MIVVDASVLAPALADDGPDGERARGELTTDALAAPHLIDIEVASVIRKARLRGDFSDQRARQALDDLRSLPLTRFPHDRFLERIWELHTTLTTYDAAYVALAEALKAPLVTADAKLAKAAGPACTFRLVSA